MPSVLSDLSIRLSVNTATLKTGLDSAKTSLNGFKNQISSTGTAISKGFKSAAGNLSGSLNAMTGGLSGLLQTGLSTFRGLATGVRGFAAAFAATGIGAIIIAITVAIAGLVAAFKRSGAAGDKMAEVMGFLKGVLDFFIKQLVKVGEWLIKVFTDPKAAIQELWAVIKENLVTRWEGVVKLFKNGWEVIKNGALGVAFAIKGIFSEEAREESKKYFSQMKEGFIQMGEAAVMIATGKTTDELKAIGKEILESGKKGVDLAKQEDALMDQQIKNTVDLARMETKLAQTREQLAEEDGKTQESRIKRQELLNSVLNQQDAISKRKINYAYQEWKLVEATAKAQGDTSDETRLKIAQAQAAYEGEVATASEAVLKFKKQEASVDAQIATEIQKQANEQVKYQDSLAKMEQENTLLRLSDERLVAETKLKFEKDNALAVAQSAEERKLIEQKYVLEVGKLHEEFRLDDAEKAKSALEQQLSDELQYKKLNAEEQKKVFQEMLDAQLISRQEYDAKVAEIDVVEKQRKMDNISSGLEAAAMAVDAISSFQQAAMNKELAAAGENEAKKEEIRKKYAKKEKTLAILMAIINGALAFTKALSGSPPPLNFVMAALTAVATAAQIAVIKSQPMVKGGLAYGETLATVGEYPGAKSNPEVISPLNKLKDLLEIDKTKEPQWGDVRFVIEQDQLVGILSNYEKKNIYF
jgi:hypothetical protein